MESLNRSAVSLTLATVGGMAIVMRDMTRQEGFRRDVGTPMEMNLEEQDAFYMGMECAFTLFVNLISKMDGLDGDLSQEAIDRMLDELSESSE